MGGGVATVFGEGLSKATAPNSAFPVAPLPHLHPRPFLSLPSGGPVRPDPGEEEGGLSCAVLGGWPAPPTVAAPLQPVETVDLPRAEFA